MPRPKGSLNKVHTKDLLAEIERLKNDSKDKGNAISASQTQDKNSVVLDPSYSQSKNTHEDVKIKVPTRKRVSALIRTYGCGNKLCDYESDQQFDQCPKCGVYNKWSN
jgi:hypothetical protein